MDLVSIENNGLILGAYDTPIQTVEEGIQRLRDIQSDANKLMLAVTARKFEIEGKTLYEMKELHKSGKYGNWIETYKSLGYKETQVAALMAKYDSAGNLDSYTVRIGDRMDEFKDKIEKMSTNDARKFAKLDADKQIEILESDNFKEDLKSALSTKTKPTVKKADSELEMALKRIEELENQPPSIIEVVPADYESLKMNNDTYIEELSKANARIKELEFAKLNNDDIEEITAVAPIQEDVIEIEPIHQEITPEITLQQIPKIVESFASIKKIVIDQINSGSFNKELLQAISEEFGKMLDEAISVEEEIRKATYGLK